MAGIRFSGNDFAPFEPFGTAWGITSITNNTVAERWGAGIVYDDINNVADRTFFDQPEMTNLDQGPRIIKNNISAYNAATGIRDALCTTLRDYNLYYGNNNQTTFQPPQIIGCATFSVFIRQWIGSSNEIFIDPLFVDRVEYRLQPESPAISSGENGTDMGAYGGNQPIL